MLEERVKEIEAKNRNLSEQNAQMRRHEMQMQMRIAESARAPHAEAATQAGGGRHPCFGRLVADLGHKQSKSKSDARVCVMVRWHCDGAVLCRLRSLRRVRSHIRQHRADLGQAASVQ